MSSTQEKKRGESQWHFDQQQKLRGIVKKSGKNLRDFKTAEDAGAKIKEVGPWTFVSSTSSK